MTKKSIFYNNKNLKKNSFTIFFSFQTKQFFWNFFSIPDYNIFCVQTTVVQGFNFDINPQLSCFWNFKTKEPPVLVFGTKMQNQRAFGSCSCKTQRSAWAPNSWKICQRAFLVHALAKLKEVPELNFMKDLSKSLWFMLLQNSKKCLSLISWKICQRTMGFCASGLVPFLISPQMVQTSVVRIFGFQC